ncbi:uncharacterized protein C8Q71DRAFT_766877 [Rhodofomes roseus]|uniref:Uncharacterized protein n=1 Tax=Rhodofomes roseus TaxID=34475 RepID=A0ABQ8KCW8_9APHY|nr:uncharacterized protein C8Q71DRAFT_766877 [Rhodofomes roseus]KAH9834881.1 hypothetical protein C8Q71DRAFT_766877 [Rhodofomes roseus]
MRVVSVSAWFAFASTILLTLFIAPALATGSTSSDFASNIFHEVKGIADKAHHGVNKVVSDATRRLGERATLDHFWHDTLSLGQRAQNYATFLVDEAAKTVDKSTAARLGHVQAMMLTIVSDAEDLRGVIAQMQGNSVDDISHVIEKLFADLFEELKDQFPPPDHAPNHEERRGHVSLVIRRVEEVLIKFCVQHGMQEQHARARLGPIMKHVQDVVVTIGDLAEQHPVLLETILISAIMYIIPESWFLRPLFRLFGMSPEGPIKGSAAAWAQRTFYGGYIPKGSWFSHLQRAGMKAGPWMGPVKQAVGGLLLAGIGTAGRMLAGFGGA